MSQLRFLICVPEGSNKNKHMNLPNLFCEPVSGAKQILGKIKSR